MLYRKKWHDGLYNDCEHLDEFELKRYCFGGDGGGSSGSSASNRNNNSSNKNETLKNVQKVAEQSLNKKRIDEIIANSSGNLAGQSMSPVVPGIGLADRFGAQVTPPSITTGATRPSVAQTASLAIPPVSAPMAMNSGIMSVAPPTTVLPTTVMSGPIGNMVGAIQAAPIGAVPATNTVGIVRPVAGGIAGIGTNMSGDIGLGFSKRF